MASLVSAVSHETLVLPAEQRPPASSAAVALPVIDFSGPRDEVQRAILEAGKEVGFFQVVNHGVPEQTVGDMKACYDFFQLPPEDKAPFYSDEDKDKPCCFISSASYDPVGGEPYWRDCLRLAACGGFPITADAKAAWPDKPDGLREATERFMVATRRLGMEVLTAEPAVRQPRPPPGLLRGGHHRRRGRQSQQLPGVPGPGAHAGPGPAAALRPRHHHAHPPGERRRPGGVVPRRLDLPPAPARRLRRELRTPARDRDERAAEEHRASRCAQPGGAAHVGGDIHCAHRRLRRRPCRGAHRRRQRTVPRRHVPGVRERVQGYRRVQGGHGEGHHGLTSAVTYFGTWAMLSVLMLGVGVGLAARVGREFFICVSACS